MDQDHQVTPDISILVYLSFWKGVLAQSIVCRYETQITSDRSETFSSIANSKINTINARMFLDHFPTDLNEYIESVLSEDPKERLSWNIIETTGQA